MPNAILWFRQDLRLQDNPALNAALESKLPLISLFILNKRHLCGEASNWWLHYALLDLEQELRKYAIQLIVREGSAKDILTEIVGQNKVSCIFFNRCYTPQAINEELEIKKLFTSINIQSFNGILLQEPQEIANSQGEAFKVFTPFFRHYQKNYFSSPLIPPDNQTSLENKLRASQKFSAVNTHCQVIDDLGLLPKKRWSTDFSQYWKPSESEARRLLKSLIEEKLDYYSQGRDIPSLDKTSKLSPYLHFGQISPRLIASKVCTAFGENKEEAQKFLSELCWREFSYHLLAHFPQTTGKPLKPSFNQFPYLTNEAMLACWQKGETGYPIVDAGMRQLWKTGWMHNRVRMIVASFLVKDLLISWTSGANWFLDTLVDADLANNTFGWQWVAGCGADAAPYFRIFNPILQAEKFDPQGKYIRTWLKELANLPDAWLQKPWQAPLSVMEAAGVKLGKTYPKPIIDHAFARKRALDALASIKSIKSIS